MTKIGESDKEIRLPRLEGLHLIELVRRQHDWVAVFDGRTSIVIWCLWRLVRPGSILATSGDAHTSGSAKAAALCIKGATIVSATVALGAVCLPSPPSPPSKKPRIAKIVGGPADVEIVFDNGVALELIQISSRYESWMIVSPGSPDLIACSDGIATSPGNHIPPPLPEAAAKPNKT
jgi:hypothetical protein